MPHIIKNQRKETKISGAEVMTNIATQMCLAHSITLAVNKSDAKAGNSMFIYYLSAEKCIQYRDYQMPIVLLSSHSKNQLKCRHLM